MRMPMFPLGTVLLPHQPLPLHVFEPRYRALVRDCLAGDRTFGVALIERGSEVGGGDARFDVGCTATILDARETPDGRWALSAVGDRPLRVVEWLPDDPYPLAEVELEPEPTWDAAADVAFDRALAGFRRIGDLAEQLGTPLDERLFELPGEALWDHWELCHRAPLGDLDRLSLLGSPSPARRLELLVAHLDGVEQVLEARRRHG